MNQRELLDTPLSDKILGLSHTIRDYEIGFETVPDIAHFELPGLVRCELYCGHGSRTCEGSVGDERLDRKYIYVFSV